MNVPRSPTNPNAARPAAAVEPSAEIPRPEGGAPAAARGAGHATKDQARVSPDPCQHTDRYRLVTPFSQKL